MSARLLLFDPDPRAWGELPEVLVAEGHTVVVVERLEEAWERLADGPWDVFLAEADRSVERAPARCEAAPGSPDLLLFDGFGLLPAPPAARVGVEVLPRPALVGEARAAVQRALERRRLDRENRALRRDLRGATALGGLLSADPRMRELFELIDTVAPTRAHLLITGESGTGKTVLARAVHERSGRAEAPFVEVNCGALPETLLESELFGHAKGAFTGASADRPGKFEAADGGTLFLDELGTASPELQVRLLRVLESQRFERVGETRTRQVDVRLIAATNADLAAEVRAGRFREDLYYRIRVVTLEPPPLRERPGDVLLLAEAFLERFARLHDRTVEGFAPEALEALINHPWPGNIRELLHAVERGVLLSPGPWVESKALPPEVRRGGAQSPLGHGSPATEPATADPVTLEGPPPRPLPQPAPAVAPPLGPLKEMLEVPERAFVVRALEHCRGSRQEAARLLGISRTTLFHKMRKYDLLAPGDSGAQSRPEPSQRPE
jgi:DNA-binding NtrC family response regulator